METQNKRQNRSNESCQGPPLCLLTGIAALLSVTLRDPSSYSLQVLNPNFNFLPQFAHTESQQHSNIVPQSTGEAKIQELIRSLMEASAGVGWGGVYGQCWLHTRRPRTGLYELAGWVPRPLGCRRDTCPRAGLKNVLFPVGPAPPYDHGQNIDGCWPPI